MHSNHTKTVASGIVGPLCGMLSGNSFFVSLFRVNWLSPVCYRSASLDIHSDNRPLKINEGIVTSSVIILHLYMSGGITLAFIWNEVQLITVGIGVALLMNLYMPSLDRKLIAYRKKIEDNFAVIFAEIERYLLTGEQDWTGKEIPETHQLITEAKTWHTVMCKTTFCATKICIIIILK